MSLTQFYVEGDTIFHRTHPIVKLMIAISAVPVATAATNIPFLIAACLTYLSIWFIADIPKNMLKTTISIGLAFGAFFILTQSLVSAFNETVIIEPFWPYWLPEFITFLGPNPNATAGEFPLTIYQLAGSGAFCVEGVYIGLVSMLRMLCILIAVPIALVTTRDIDLLIGLRSIGVGYSYCFIGTMALRFVPVLNDARMRIGEAQKLRGTELDKGPPWRKITSLVSLFVPLIVSSLKMSTDLETAIESRAFGGPRKRTFIKEIPFRRKDKLVILAMIIVSLVVMFLNMSIWFGNSRGAFNILPYDTTIIPPLLLPDRWETTAILMRVLEILLEPFRWLFEMLGYTMNFPIRFLGGRWRYNGLL